MKFLPKKITFCSGHIAHFGLGLMFLGIISSSLYDTSQKLILKQGAANKALNSEIKLNNIQIEKHGKGTSVQFLLDIKQQDSNFPAKPDIYIETQESGRTQRFVHPYIRRGLINDLYISPIDFDIGQEKGSKNHIDLKQSEKIQLYDYELTFTGFEVSGMQNGKNISVGAHIEVSYKGERRVTLKPVISMDSRHSPKSRVKLPGTENDYITLTGINASSKTIHLDYEIAQHTAHQKNQSQVPSLLAEISIKPGMTLLWAGTFFMLLGGGIGIVRRMR
jgi:cytochrome c-type biogenesis protein CcmF